MLSQMEVNPRLSTVSGCSRSAASAGFAIGFATARLAAAGLAATIAMTSGRDTIDNNCALPPLIAAMTDPAFYPERPGAVELKQTHISYVLMAGDFGLQDKKAGKISLP